MGDEADFHTVVSSIIRFPQSVSLGEERSTSSSDVYHASLALLSCGRCASVVQLHDKSTVSAAQDQKCRDASRLTDARILTRKLYLYLSFEVDQIPKRDPANGQIKRFENNFVEIYGEDATPFVHRPRIVSSVRASKHKW